MERVKLIHPIDPVFDENSEVLILGSFPSVKSREAGFFYGHPQNRFWKVTAAVMGEDVPQTITEKKAFLLRNHIALWDVIGDGKTAEKVYKKYTEEATGIQAVCLPSTSPANAAWSLEKLVRAWSVIK